MDYPTDDHKLAKLEQTDIPDEDYFPANMGKDELYKVASLADQYRDQIEFNHEQARQLMGYLRVLALQDYGRYYLNMRNLANTIKDRLDIVQEHVEWYDDLYEQRLMSGGLISIAKYKEMNDRYRKCQNEANLSHNDLRGIQVYYQECINYGNLDEG